MGQLDGCMDAYIYGCNFHVVGCTQAQAKELQEACGSKRVRLGELECERAAAVGECDSARRAAERARRRKVEEDLRVSDVCV